MIALAGQFLGIAGVLLARKMKGSFPLLSVIGIGLCTITLSPMYLMLVVYSVILGWPLLVPGAVLAMVVKVARPSISADI